MDATAVGWYFLKFCGLMIGAFALLTLPEVREHTVDPFNIGIAHTAGALIGSFGGDVSASRNLVMIPGFAVRILEPCNAVEATLVLCAAMLAFPTAWRYRLKGALLGVLTIHSLNMIRVISLVYLGAYDRSLFDWAHQYMWEVLIILDILIVFLLWVWWMPRGTSAATT